MKTILILFILLFPQVMFAQDAAPPRFELRGSGGWIAFGDDGVLHHGLAGVSVRIGLSRRVSVEPELTYMIGPGEDRDIAVSSVISYEFGDGKVRPYVLGAAGRLWHRDEFYRSFGSQGAYLVSGGAGVRAQLNKRWSVSPEFRMGVQPHVLFKVGVGYAF